MNTDNSDNSDNMDAIDPNDRQVLAQDKPVEQIGPLQLRVMHYIWKNGPTTVQSVMNALNGDVGTRPLAYTTFLTVMRNLARRNLLEQKKTAQRSHMFSPTVGEEEYKSAFIRQVFRDYFNNDANQLWRYLGNPQHAA